MRFLGLSRRLFENLARASKQLWQHDCYYVANMNRLYWNQDELLHWCIRLGDREHCSTWNTEKLLLPIGELKALDFGDLASRSHHRRSCDGCC